MGGTSTCPHEGCVCCSQKRKACKRKSNIHSGSPFFLEISRTMSSFRPFGIISVCTSVVNPNSYFCSATFFTNSLLSLDINRYYLSVFQSFICVFRTVLL